jgi:hypothetical protein
MQFGARFATSRRKTVSGAPGHSCFISAIFASMYTSALAWQCSISSSSGRSGCFCGARFNIFALNLFELFAKGRSLVLRMPDYLVPVGFPRFDYLLDVPGRISEALAIDFRP